jgi:outer membrane protein insertion porin family
VTPGMPGHEWAANGESWELGLPLNLFAGCAMLLLAIPLAAQISFEGQRIAAVEYSPANQPLAPEDLAQAQLVRAGELYRADAISGAIDRLFATGHYSDIRVEAEGEPGGVRVRFVTTTRLFVGGTTIKGKLSAHPNRGQLANATGLTLGAPYEDEALGSAKTRIERILKANGFNEARLASTVERQPEGDQLRFTFQIHKGKRARYDRPKINGDLKLAEDAIVGATGWRYRILHIYKRVNAQRTRAAVTNIRKKYQSKERLMADIRLDSLEYDRQTKRMKPTFTIKAGPKVDVRTVEAKVSKGTLRANVPVYTERRVDRDLLVEGARNLRDYFQTQGYYDVDIEFRQHDESADHVVIEYVIAQGQRYKVVNVEVVGNHYFSEDVVRERMFVQASSFALRRGRYSESLRKKDEENIENLYKSNGFRNVKVTSAVDREYRGTPGHLSAQFAIEEGPQWFVDRVDVNGVEQEDKEDLLTRLTSLPGQPFSEVGVATDRDALLTEYYTRGFPDATFQWREEASDKPHRVNLTYTLTEGRQQFVRDVLVTGYNTTRRSLIDRNLRVQKGKPLSPVSMLDGQKNLYELGIFSRVNAAIQNPDGQTQHKYVLYDIEEASRYSLSFGVGAELARFGGTTSSLDTPAGSTGFSPRVSVDLSRLNLLGLGHVVSLRGRVSSLQKLGSITYVAPRLRNIEGRNLTFTAFYDSSRDVRTFAAKRQEASIQLSQQLSKPTTALFRFTYRRVATSDVAIPALLVPALLQPVRIGIFSASLVQDRRNNSADASRGIYNTLDTGLAWKGFGSQRSFLRVLGRNATYYSLTKNLVLARQTTLGFLFPFSIPQGLSEAEAIPLPERFFGGGSTSHRGFPDNQAGPRDIGTPAGAGASATQPTGFPLGGNALLFNNVELRFPLIGENIRGVIFHDAGNIYSRIGDISLRQRQASLQDFNYMEHAAGIGVRYKTPIGPVRVDLVYSINPPRFIGFKGTTQELLSCNPGLPPDQLPTQCRGVQQSTGHFQFFFSIGQSF